MLKMLAICLMSVFMISIVVMADASVFHPSRPGFLDREGTELMLDGKPFHAVSVNKFDLFSQLLDGTKTREQTAADIKNIADHGFRVIRFGAIGFYPNDMTLWPNDEYWKKMDSLVASARENNVYLIPCIVWNWYLFTDMANETMQDLLTDRDSKSRQYLELYISQIVTRYKDDPTVLVWDIGSELNLAADLEFMRPYGFSDLNAVSRGASYMRLRRDNFTTAQMIPFLRDMAKLVRRIDRNHLISSGNASPRPAAQHLRLAKGKGDWTEDTPEEAEIYIRNTHPDPIDIISIHFYPGIDNLRFGNKDRNTADTLVTFKKICDRIGKPVIIGETGGQAYDASMNTVAPFTADIINKSVDLHFPITLYWMYGGDNPLAFDLDKSPALNVLLKDADTKLNQLSEGKK